MVRRSFEARASHACALALVLAGCGGAAAPAAPLEAPTPPTTLQEADAELEKRIRETVVAERPKLRACYERGLARDIHLAGRVVLVIEVGQDGTAAHVFEARRQGLGDEEVKCFAGVLKKARFHDGAGRPMRVQVPIAFEPKG